MNARLIAGLALVPAVLLGSASAAPKASCKLVTDALGDATAVRPAGASPASLDIEWADLAATGKDLTAVIKLKNFLQQDQDAPVGRQFYFEFRPVGSAKGLFVMTQLGPEQVEGPVTNFGVVEYLAAGPSYQRFGGTSVKPVLDYAKGELSMHIPMAEFSKTDVALRSNMKVGNLIARTVAYALPFAQGPASKSDEAVSAKTYVIGAASCVRVGL